MKIINKTPHPVLILNDDNTVVRVFPKSNGMMRLREETKDVGCIDGIKISSTTWHEVENTPIEKMGVFYIVSQLVKNALPERGDLLVPKGVVRDQEGNIIGCRRLDFGTKMQQYIQPC